MSHVWSASSRRCLWRNRIYSMEVPAWYPEELVHNGVGVEVVLDDTLRGQNVDELFILYNDDDKNIELCTGHVLGVRYMCFWIVLFYLNKTNLYVLRAIIILVSEVKKYNLKKTKFPQVMHTLYIVCVLVYIHNTYLYIIYTNI